MEPLTIIKSIGLFALAGFCEIGGGYLVWLWLREGRGLLVAIPGDLLRARPLRGRRARLRELLCLFGRQQPLRSQESWLHCQNRD